MSRDGRKKQPQQEYQPRDGKIPRGGSLASAIPQQRFSWSVVGADFDGPFGWHITDTKQVFREIIPKLKSFETMKWAEVDGPTGSHFITCDQLCDDARGRLEELRRDDLEQVFSLRIGGKPRIYGVREGATLEVLWWDPDHKICPSPKKHT